MKKFFLVITLMAALLFGPAMPAVHCKPVNGYNSYINILPGGKNRQAENFNIIDQAQKLIVESENNRRQREIRFIKPIDVESLSSKYLMISFEVSYKPAGNSRFSPDPAIYALLFEQQMSKGITKFTSQFIKWLDSGDVEEYKSANNEIFCKLYRQMGVEDCFPEDLQASTVVEEVPLQAESVSEIEIDAGQIVTGIVKEEFIDAKIARKSDLQRILKETSTEKLEERLTVLDKEKPSGDSRTVDALEKKLSEEKRKREKLEQRIAALERLLKNVSLKNNVLTLNGLNLRIVSGSTSSSGQKNGRGNLILGYIENDANGMAVEDILGNLSHKIVTVEEKGDEDRGHFLPDYGNGKNQDNKSVIKFVKLSI